MTAKEDNRKIALFVSQRKQNHETGKKMFKSVIQENFPKIKENLNLQTEWTRWVPGTFGLEKSLAGYSYEIPVPE